MSLNERPAKLSYSVKEAAEATTISRSTLYAHIASGRIRAARIGGRTVIPCGVLHDLIDGVAA